MKQLNINALETVDNATKNDKVLKLDTITDLVKYLNDNNINHGKVSTQPYVIGNMSCSFYIRNSKSKLIRVGVSKKMYDLNSDLKKYVDNFVKSNASNSKQSNDARNYILDMTDKQFTQYVNACGKFIKTA